MQVLLKHFDVFLISISESDHQISDSYLRNIIPLALVNDTIHSYSNTPFLQEVTHTIPNMVKDVSYYWRAPTAVKLNDFEGVITVRLLHTSGHIHYSNSVIICDGTFGHVT